MRPEGSDPKDPRVQALGLDHLLSHIIEEYYVPSLLWRAMQRRGNPASCWQMMRAEITRGRKIDYWLMDLRWYFRTLKPLLVAEILAHGWPMVDGEARDAAMGRPGGPEA
jgi:hypothetical protein